MTGSRAGTDVRRAELEAARARLLRLLHRVPDDVLAGQHWPILGPILWDLGHVACFERIWLVDALDGRPAELPALFDAFVHARSVRGALPIPDRPTLLAELRSVREQALARLDRDVGPLTDGGFVWALIAQHEAWHTETVLASLGLCDGLVMAPGGRPAVPVAVDDERRVPIPGGDGWIGTDDRRRAYDNERPRHPIRIEPFAMDAYPVTVRRWEAFVADGGYRSRALWSDAGWDWRTAGDVRAPHFWEGDGVRRYGVVQAREPNEPVQHVSFFEAEAFARWAGGRLPTEAEWECAATWNGSPDVDGADVESDALGPAPVGRAGGAGASGCQGMLGGVWEWTSTPFDPYPGFEPWPYREYSAPFFGTGQPVLRGGCWATGRSLIRPTLRSWDLPQRRETIFPGVRLAWSSP